MPGVHVRLIKEGFMNEQTAQREKEMKTLRYYFINLSWSAV